MKMVSVWCMVLFLAVSFFAPSLASAQGFYDPPLMGEKAPNFTLPTIQGGKESLYDAISGKKAILFFWATWCPHCREQVKVIGQKKQELEKAGVVAKFVDIGEDKATVEKFAKSYSITDTIYLDEDGTTAEAYGVYGVPTIYLISDEGIVKEVRNGFPENFAEILSKK